MTSVLLLAVLASSPSGEKICDAFAGEGIVFEQRWGHHPEMNDWSCMGGAKFGPPYKGILVNEIGLLVSGETSTKVTSIELTLALFNLDLRRAGLAKFQAAIQDLFQALGVKEPNGLRDALRDKSNFKIVQKTDWGDLSFFHDFSMRPAGKFENFRLTVNLT